MKLSFLKYTIILFWSYSVCFGNTGFINVTFIINTELPRDSAIVYITGNDSLLGNWKPAGKALNKSGINTWEISLNLPEGENIEYKFTLGTWNTEALNNEKQKQENFRLKVTGDTTLYYKFKYWGEPLPVNQNLKITGNVKYHRNFTTAGLKNRDIIVWLPPGYDESKSSYPVLYAHDGQNIIDPATSSFGFDWQLDETADSLVKGSKIEPIIIVGIYNTTDRSAEYTDTDTGSIYMNFIINILKPFIDKTYRTKPQREYTASIGSSAGGLISFRLAWEHNDVFSKAACLSPAFHIDNINYFAEADKFPVPDNIKIYIDNGGRGLEELLQPGADEMLKYLDSKGFKKGKDYIWFHASTAEHNERAWAARSYLPLTFFFSNNHTR